MAANNFVTIPPSGSGLPRGATSFYDFSQNDDGGHPLHEEAAVQEHRHC